jgi:3-oxoadipate enol-lactonase
MSDIVMSELKYEIAGPAQSPVIILGHGLATDREMWRDVACTLTRDFRVILYDSRGHGLSPAGEEPFTLHDLAGDIVAILNQEGVEKAHIGGLSMGGMAAMTLAVSGSDKFKSLIVCDARADAPDAYRKAWDDRIETVRKHGIQALVEPTIERWFTPATRANRAAMERVRAMVLRTSPEGYCMSAQALKGLDCLQHLPSLRLPTLFLVGRDDLGAPVDVMGAMHQATPGSRFVIVPDAGHIAAMEQAAAVAAAIGTFVKEVESCRGSD